MEAVTPVPTRTGPRSADDIVQELFVLARAYRTQSIDGQAFVAGEREGEQIEIRVTVRSHDWVAALKAATET